MNPTPKEFYTTRIAAHTTRLKQLKRRSMRVAVARLAAFAGLLLALYLYFTGGQLLMLALTLAAAIIFVVLVRLSAALADNKRLTAKLLLLDNNEMAALNLHNNLFDNGAAFAANAMMHAGDLDLFGKDSLYHLLNRTTTDTGAQKLFRLLNQPATSAATILTIQQAVGLLAEQPELRQLITAHGLLENEDGDPLAQIADWIATPPRVTTSRWVAVLRYALPVAALAGLFVYLSTGNPLVVGLGIVVNLLLTGFFARYTMAQHQLIGKKEAVMLRYGTILQLFETAGTGQSALLKQLQETSVHGHRQILALSRLSGRFDQRLNLLVGLFLNAFLLYDIQVMTALEKWKEHNKARFNRWIDAVGEIELLGSLASFRFNHPGYAIPVVEEGRPQITATALAHPLIPAQAQVANDVCAGLHEKLLLITGSNMSGKSTFLRTIGMNLVLAQCGLPVCAGSFRFTPMPVLSSIRISDSLQENTSYFMAELKRLKQIIDTLNAGGPALVLIDEVLRGTNSDDKRYGSEELIRKLCGYPCLTFFASHDLSLSNLEQELKGQVNNYCFESTIENGELLFDYTLRRGVAANKNASFLMKKMGIIG